MSISQSGQFRLNSYTSPTSFTGSAAGYLAFDSTGSILTTNALTASLLGTASWANNATTASYSLNRMIRKTYNYIFNNVDILSDTLFVLEIPPMWREPYSLTGTYFKFDRKKLSIFIATGAIYVAGGSTYTKATIYRGATNLGSADGMSNTYDGSNDNSSGMSLSILDSPNTTSATTYQVYILTNNASTS